MSTPESMPLFTVSNHHVTNAGQPPALNGDDPNMYHSYFENAYGEQSIFQYNKGCDSQVDPACCWQNGTGV